MAFRGQRPYQPQPLNYGAAVGQGQQNALRSYQMGEAVKDVQGKNILNALDKQGLQGKDAINALKSSGRGDLIPQYQQKMHESQKRKFEFAKMNEYKVSDQASWELFNDEGLAAGALTQEEHAKSKATPWAEGRKNLDRLMGRTDKESKISKWERVSHLSRKKERGEATQEDIAELDTLTKPNIAVNVGQPTRNVREVAEKTVSNLEVDGVKLEKEVENWEAYRDAVSSEAQTIQARSEKEGNPISLTTAMEQAHEKLKGKLVRSESIFDKEIFGFTPFGKRWIYNPKAGMEGALPNGMDEGYMASALKKNNLEDTPENRKRVIDAWQSRK